MVARPRMTGGSTRATTRMFKEHIALSSILRNRIPGLPDVNYELVPVPFDTARDATWQKLLHADDLMNYQIEILHVFLNRRDSIIQQRRVYARWDYLILGGIWMKNFDY